MWILIFQMRETRVWSLAWEDPLQKGMATHSSILAWRIPRTTPMGWQRVRHYWVTFTQRDSFSLKKKKRGTFCLLTEIIILEQTVWGWHKRIAPKEWILHFQGTWTCAVPFYVCPWYGKKEESCLKKAKCYLSGLYQESPYTYILW